MRNELIELPGLKSRLSITGKNMNYDDDGYINYMKEHEVMEGNPQPTRGMTKPILKHENKSGMQMERKSIQGKLMDRGHVGSSYHPRG